MRVDESESTTGEGLVKISQTRLLALKRNAQQLKLSALRIRSRSSGSYLSPFKGRGMEFDEARIYQPGDDVRSLDWRVTARTGKPHTKVYREEQERAVFLWVDFRLPMHFATQGQFKTVLASRAAALLAWAARHQGDRLGGLLFTEQGHHEVRPQTGDRSVLQLIRLLARYSQERVEQSTHALRQQCCVNSLMRLRRLVRPGSLIVLISDFRDLDDTYEVHLAALARHNDLVLLQLQDRLERVLPSSGRYQLSDGRGRLTIDGSDVQRQIDYQQRETEQREQLLNMCRRYRIHQLYCATSDDVLSILQQGFGGPRR